MDQFELGLFLMRINLVFRFLLAGCILFSGPVFANEPIARMNTTSMWFENWGDLSNAALVVASPDGTIQTVNSDRGTPVFNLRDLSKVVDGVYQYELSAATSEVRKIINPQNNGRGAAQKKEMFIPFKTNGIFFVARGVISKQQDIKEE
jgi:hypothetical protein